MSTLFHKGVELFNAGEFHECHEVLEVFWKEEPEPDRQLTQGIIQVAVAMYHAERGNFVGSEKLLVRGLQRIEKSLNLTAPVDVVSLQRDAAQALRAVRAGTTPGRFTIQLM